MGIKTDIEWCDSTLNLQAGCDGCELWNPKAGVKHCYAGVMTERYGGRPGWPERFEQPKLFLDRLDKALRWSDLTGTERPEKPWLNGRPRMVFLDDMGDTFTESLPLDWLCAVLPETARSPHVYMLLTKRGSRMRQFSESHPLPPNFWPGVSVTTAKSLPRVAELLKVQGGGVKWVSAEPLWGPVDLCSCNSCITPVGWHMPECRLKRLGLVIGGGQSGPSAIPTHPDWARFLRDQCVAAGVPFFFKQWGEWVGSDHEVAMKSLVPHNEAEEKGHVHVWPYKKPPGPPHFGMDFNLRVGKKAAGRLLDGREWNEFPEARP